MGLLDGDKSRSAKEEAREAQLIEESSKRAQIGAIKDRLTLILRTLSLSASSNPAFAHDQLPSLVGNRGNLKYFFEFIFTILMFLQSFEGFQCYEICCVSIVLSFWGL